MSWRFDRWRSLKFNKLIIFTDLGEDSRFVEIDKKKKKNFNNIIVT